MPWSVDSLGSHIVGMTNQDRNAAGGTVPDRLEDIVQDALRFVWTAKDWRWRHKIGTLTIAADATTITLPVDFEKLVSGHVSQVDEPLWMSITDNMAVFQRYDSTVDSTDASPPVIATVKWDAGEDSNYIMVISPAADSGYSADFVYLTKVPIDLATDPTEDDEEVAMPEEFASLWKARTIWQVLEAFEPDADRTVRMGTAYRAEEKRAVDQHNQFMKTPVEVIDDGYGDRSLFGHTQGMLYGNIAGQNVFTGFP